MPIRVWRHRATIVVPHHATFPLDMLRYDCCWPTDHTAVDRLAVASSVRDPDARHDVADADRAIRVVVERWSDAKSRGFTADRWASFGVTCVSHAPEARTGW